MGNEDDTDDFGGIADGPNEQDIDEILKASFPTGGPPPIDPDISNYLERVISS